MTIFDTPERQKIYRDIIKKLRLIDDAFFNSCFDGDIACMELLLKIIFGNPQLRVKEVLTQSSVPNLFGRGVRFDAIATDGERIFDVEVQRDDEGADPRRARYNSCMMDARELDKGKGLQGTARNLRHLHYGTRCMERQSTTIPCAEVLCRNRRRLRRRRTYHLRQRRLSRCHAARSPDA